MGPYKCPDCGIWWAGLQHRCRAEGILPNTATNDAWVYRVYEPPIGSASTTAAPYCAICRGWHIPGAGPCTASWSES